MTVLGLLYFSQCNATHDYFFYKRLIASRASS